MLHESGRGMHCSWKRGVREEGFLEEILWGNGIGEDTFSRNALGVDKGELGGQLNQSGGWEEGQVKDKVEGSWIQIMKDLEYQM